MPPATTIKRKKNMKETSDFFTVKKIHVSFILAIMIFAIHISSLDNYSLTSPLGSRILFCDSITMLIVNVAVPLFMLLSAVLFYRNYRLEDTKRKYISRIKTLVVPYLFWNFIWTLFQYVCSYTFISRFFVGREKAQFSVTDLLQGLFLHKYTPFWFILDLILFVAICPVIYLVLKNKVVGAVAILLSAVLCEYCTFLEPVLFRRDALVFYLVGAYVGIHFFDWFIERKHAVFSFFSLCLCIGIIAFYAANSDFDMRSYSFGNIVVITIYCFAFWFLFDLFRNAHYLPFEKESFLVYAMHINIASVIAKLLYLALPKQDFVAPANYVLTMGCTIACISVFAYLVDRFAPKLRILISGSR